MYYSDKYSNIPCGIVNKRLTGCGCIKLKGCYNIYINSLLFTKQMPTGIIYVAKNTISNKCYVGKTTRTLEQRKKEHYWQTIKAEYKFGRALQKYPESTWEWSILAEVDVKELEDYEIFFIKDLDTFKNGYNTLSGDTWKNTGNPRHNSVIYTLWHPEHGEVSGTIGELKQISASFGHLQELIRGERLHIDGYLLPENKDRHKDIFKKYDFYHPDHGVITCTAVELFENYKQYFNTKECYVYNLTGKKVKLYFGWCLAENKDKYDDLTDTSAYLTLTHEEHGTLTLKKSEWKKRFNLLDSAMTNLKNGNYKSSRGWRFVPDNLEQQAN